MSGSKNQQRIGPLGSGALGPELRSYRWLVLPLLLLGWLGQLSCSGTVEGPMGVDLRFGRAVKALGSCQADRSASGTGVLPVDVETVRLEITGPDMKPIVKEYSAARFRQESQTIPSSTQKSVQIPEVPVGQKRVLTFRGLDRRRKLRWLGASEPTDIAPGQKVTIQIYFTRVGGLTCTAGNMNSARAFHVATGLPNGGALLVGGFATIKPAGSCVQTCTSLTDCAPGTFCQNGGCKPAGACSGGEACPKEHGCAGGWCVRICKNDAICGKGGRCSTGFCVKQCSKDGDCDPTQSCTSEVCQPAGVCTGFAACPSGYRCRDGWCIAACSADPDCGAGRKCSPWQGCWALEATNTVERYDRPTATFKKAETLLFHRRAGASATALEDGAVLIAGGAARAVFCYGSPKPWSYRPSDLTGNLSLYDSNSGKIRPAGGATTPRAFHGAVALADGRVVIIGGWDGDRPLDDVWLYTPSNDSLSRWRHKLLTPRAFPTVTRLGDNHVLVWGGLLPAAPGTVRPMAETIDFSTNDEPMPVKVPGTSEMTGALFSQGHALDDGTALLLGGIYFDKDSKPLSPSPTSNWRIGLTQGKLKVAPLTKAANSGRSLLSAVRLADGRILLTGGATSTTYLPTRTVEILDPKTESFALLPPGPLGSPAELSLPRFGHGAILLADRNVLITGGIVVSNVGTEQLAGPSSTAELYTPEE